MVTTSSQAYLDDTRQNLWSSILGLSPFTPSRELLIRTAVAQRPAMERAVLRLLEEISAALSVWRRELGDDEQETVRQECARLEEASVKAQFLQRSLGTFYDLKHLRLQSLKKLEREIQDNLRALERLRKGVRRSFEDARAREVRAGIRQRQGVACKRRSVTCA